MMTNKEQRKACISLAMMLENLTDSFYIDVTTVYCDLSIHCDKLMEMAEVNRFLNNLQPYELKKEFNCRHTEEGNKFYTCHINVIGYKKK
jgi:hypothetical protein